jgi:flagellar hook-associated protein 1 FlgK
MSGLNAALNIGKTSLAAQLYAMQVAGNNIANVNTEGYTRQRVNMTPTAYAEVGHGLSIGSGVTVAQVQRVRDELLDIHIRQQNSSQGGWTEIMSTLDELESLLSETSTGTLGDMINEFWNSWYDLSNDPDNAVTREMVKNQAITLTRMFNTLGQSMSTMRLNMNQGLSTMVEQVNSLSQRIYDLNRKIQAHEAGGTKTANEYRDERDMLLDELSQLVNITTSEMGDGSISVYVSGSLLISASSRREMAVSPNSEGLYDVVWSDTGNAVDLTDGVINGCLISRDTIITKYQTQIDNLAAALIENVNRLHTRGMSSTLHTSVTGTYAVDDPAAALDSAGLDFTPVDGALTIAVYDSDGNFIEEQTINVDADTDSLNDIRDAINAAFVGSGNVAASVTADNRLEITAAGTNGFSFVSSSGTGDTSDLLLGLGINTFFDGSGASTISLNQAIESDPSLISTGTTTAPGDNTVALAIGDLRDSLLMSGGTATLNDYYESLVGTLGVDSQEAQQMKTNADLLSETYENQRESYSGVSLDEEMTNLLQYQNAYNAAAKFISTISELMQVLMETV